MPLSVIEMGTRLAKLRKALARDSGQDWTQARVAQQLGIAPDMMCRLEYGGGSMENLGKLIDFYYGKGFNIDWLMVSDNSSIPMYREVKPAN
jgi:hypothetical protein